MRVRATFSSFAALSTCLVGLALSSCGDAGSVVVGDYAQLVIGPGGGHAAALQVEVDIVPGAFSEDHVVLVMLQPTPLPIDAPPGVVFEYHDDIMCIGPLGLDLLLPCHVRLCYDPQTLPDGFSEEDLVLLVWHDDDQVMRASATAVQNLELHCFDDFFLGELGHVAVGRRTSSTDLFGFLPEPPVAPQAFLGGTEAIHIAEPGGTPVPLLGTEGAFSFIPSGTGMRILYEMFTPKTESTDLRTVDVADSTNRVVSDSSHSLTGGDSLFGWFEGSDRCFYARFESQFAVQGGVAPQGGSSSFFDVFVSVGGSGAPPAADLFDIGSGGFDAFLSDARLSPDGSMVLLRWSVYDGKGSFDRYDVITVAGTPVGLDLAIPQPSRSFAPTPRWLPDSSGLYFADANALDVVRMDPDGTDASILYSLPATDGFLVDFVVSPDYATLPPALAHCAFVREAVIDDVTVNVFCVDVLGGGARQDDDLGTFFSVSELIYHPDGATVWLAGSSFFGKGFSPQGEFVEFPSSFEFTLVFDASDADLVRSIDTSLASIDVSATSGRVLIWMPFESAELDLSVPGLYVADPDGTNPVYQDQAVPQAPARWLRSWRHAPSFETPWVR